jgi:hypothetical protein
MICHFQYKLATYVRSVHLKRRNTFFDHTTHQSAPRTTTTLSDHRSVDLPHLGITCNSSCNVAFVGRGNVIKKPLHRKRCVPNITHVETSHNYFNVRNSDTQFKSVCGLTSYGQID